MKFIVTVVDDAIQIVHEFTSGAAPDVRLYSRQDYARLVARYLAYYGEGVLMENGTPVPLGEWNVHCADISEPITREPMGFDAMERRFFLQRRTLYDHVCRLGYTIDPCLTSEPGRAFARDLMAKDSHCVAVCGSFYYDAYLAPCDDARRIVTAFRAGEIIPREDWDRLWVGLQATCATNSRTVCTYVREVVLRDLGIFIPDDAPYQTSAVYAGCYACPAQDFHYSPHYRAFVDLVEVMSVVRGDYDTYAETIVRVAETWAATVDRCRESIRGDVLLAPMFRD